MVIFDTMSAKVEKLLLEFAEEVLRIRPKTKRIQRNGCKIQLQKWKELRWLFEKYDHRGIEITTWNKTNVVA